VVTNVSEERNDSIFRICMKGEISAFVRPVGIRPSYCSVIGEKSTTRIFTAVETSNAIRESIHSRRWMEPRGAGRRNKTRFRLDSLTAKISQEEKHLL
jgi:hypothetical protein